MGERHNVKYIFKIDLIIKKVNTVKTEIIRYFSL